MNIYFDDDLDNGQEQSIINRTAALASCETLHVRWRLLRDDVAKLSCNRAVEAIEPCIFVREHVLSMAWNMLAQPRPAYDITLTGNDPTRHPFLVDIVRYLLSTTRRVGVTLESDGNRELAYYGDLLRHLPKHALRLSFCIDASSGDLEHVLRLSALVAEHGQLAHVRLICDPMHADETRRVHSALVKLRALVPFSMDMPLATDAPIDATATEAMLRWQGLARNDFAMTATDGPAMPPFAIADAAMPTYEAELAAKPSTNASLEGGPVYCCAGANQLMVEPDGRYRAACCGEMQLSRKPLWQMDRHALDSLASVVACRRTHCSGGCPRPLA